jgi:hypothetical protein
MKEKKSSAFTHLYSPGPPPLSSRAAEGDTGTRTHDPRTPYTHSRLPTSLAAGSRAPIAPRRARFFLLP